MFLLKQKFVTAVKFRIGKSAITEKHAAEF